MAWVDISDPMGISQLEKGSFFWKKVTARGASKPWGRFLGGFLFVCLKLAKIVAK